MTRQNLVPSFPGHANGNLNSNSSASGSSNALIPLWDMCNHRNGKVSLRVDALLRQLIDVSNVHIVCLANHLLQFGPVIWSFV